MTPTHQQGQDASVAVLQQQTTALAESLRDLTKSVNEGFAGMQAKMDRINEITTTIAAITTRQEAHSDGLQRAFAEQRNLSEQLARVVEDNTNWRDQYATTVDTRFDAQRMLLEDHKSANAKDHSEVKAEIATWRGMVKGAAAVLALMIGLLGWLGGKYVSNTEINSKGLQELQRQIDSLPYPVTRHEAKP